MSHKPLVIFFIVLGIASGTALALQSACLPSKDEAVHQAISTAERVDNAYRQVRMTTRETRFDETDTQIISITENEYLRKDDLARAKSIIVESNQPNTNLGYTSVFGGSPDRRFQISKNGKDAKFEINQYGHSKNFSDIASSRARPVFSPYQLLDVGLADFLRQDDVKAISVKSTLFNGLAVNELTADYQFIDDITGEPGRVRYYLYFAPDTWAFRGFTSYPKPSDPQAKYFHHKITYRSDSEWPPRISRLEIVTEDPNKPGEEFNRMVYDIQSLDFGEIDAGEFTLAAFDIEEPAMPAPRSIGAASGGWPWTWIIAGSGLAALGIGLAVISVRRGKTV